MTNNTTFYVLLVGIIILVVSLILVIISWQNCKDALKTRENLINSQHQTMDNLKTQKDTINSHLEQTKSQLNSTLTTLNNTQVQLATNKSTQNKLFSITLSTDIFSRMIKTAVNSMKDPRYLNTINSYLLPSNKNDPIEYKINVTNTGTYLDHICSDCGDSTDLQWECNSNGCILKQVNNWNDATGFGSMFKSCGDNASQDDDRCGNGKCCCEYGFKRNTSGNNCSKCYIKSNCELYTSSMLDVGLVGFRMDLGSLTNITSNTVSNLVDIKIKNVKGYLVIATNLLSTDPGCGISLDIELKIGVATSMVKTSNGEFTLQILPNINSLKLSNISVNNCGTILGTAGGVIDTLSDKLSSKLSGVLKSSLTPMLTQKISNIPPGIVSQLTTEIKDNTINIYSM